MILNKGDKENFNEFKFRREHFGPRSGAMGLYGWKDVEYYFGTKVDEWELRHGVMREPLYKELAAKFGEQEMDKYFGEHEAPVRKPLTAEEREIEQLANLIVYGRIK